MAVPTNNKSFHDFMRYKELIPTCDLCNGELFLIDDHYLVCMDCGIWHNLDDMSDCMFYPRCNGCNVIDVCDQRKNQTTIPQIINYNFG